MGLKSHLVASLLLVAAAAGAQTTPALPLAISPQPTSVSKTNLSSAAVSAAEELVLTGVVNIGSVKRAFLKIDRPQQAAEYYTLEEGKSVGEIQTVAIDVPRARVTLRYHGTLREVALNRITGASASQVTIEKAKDLSHTQHHTRRAQLDRENDDRLAKEENTK